MCISDEIVFIIALNFTMNNILERKNLLNCILFFNKQHTIVLYYILNIIIFRLLRFNYFIVIICFIIFSDSPFTFYFKSF